MFELMRTITVIHDLKPDSQHDTKSDIIILSMNVTFLPSNLYSNDITFLRSIFLMTNTAKFYG